MLIELIKALTPLAWPLVLGFLLWKLFPALQAIVSSRAFAVKIAGMEISVQDATEQIRTRIEDLQKQVMDLRSGKQQNAPSPEPRETLAPSTRKAPRILWVDDVPTGNAFEVAQLKNRGIEVVPADSTDEAMAALNNDADFDAILSDMGRREDGEYRTQAGLTLLKAVRSAGNKVPFFVYTSPKYAARNNKEVKSAGGDGATASPVELLEWIDRTIKKQ